MTDTDSRTRAESCPTQDRISSTESWIILAATAVICAAILQAEPLQSANDRSRWATVWSLVERGTFQIDEIDSVGRWSTIDKVRFRRSPDEPWHFYSSKPPLLSVIVAGLYGMERWTLGYGLFNHTAAVTRGLLLVLNALPFFLALRSLAACLHLLGAGPGTRHFVLVAAGFGSILNPYLTTLNNHTPAAASAMLSLTAAVRILSGSAQCTFRNFGMLGFFAALTACFELPAAQWGVIAFGFAVIVCFRKTLIAFLPAAAIPLGAFFLTNWLVTGGARPFYASYGTETYVYEHNGIPSYWSNPRDLDANRETVMVYLFHCVLGHHGLLSLSPCLCLTLAGWWSSRRRSENTARRSCVLAGALMTLVTLSFYLSRTENYNYGGNSVGLRWMLWLSPFWWIGIVPVLEGSSRRGLRWVSAVLLLASIVSANWSLQRPWKPSWLYEQLEARGWISYRTPIQPFEEPRTSVFWKIPLPGQIGVWRNASGERLIVTVVEPAANDAAAGRPGSLQIELQTGDSTRLLQAGNPDSGSEIPEERLRIFPVELLAVSGKIHPPQVPPAAGTWTGYQAGGTLWIPDRASNGRAFRAERAAARIRREDAEFGPCWHRCDVQYCADVPFGVLQWKVTITSDGSGEVLASTTWVAETQLD